VKQRTPNPVIPGNPRERTGTAGIMRRALADINRRWRGLQADVLALFDGIPVYQVNDEKGTSADEMGVVRYGLTPAVLDRTMLDLQAALGRWIADGRQTSHLFWWSPYVEEASQLGTAQSVANLANLSPAYAAARSLSTVVFSEPYQTRVGLARVKSYEHWSGLAADQKSKLADVVGRAVADGLNPKVARKQIMEALGVTKSRAAQYAQTDITDTLRQARWAESDAAEVELGVKTAMLWTSALIPTTRAWHASRNGKTFSTAEVRAFYASNGNRYRCHCAQTEALLDADGKPILTKALQSAMANERKAWSAKTPG
jgi:hypothetical protein